MRHRELICVNLSGEKFKFARIKGLANKREITDLGVKDIRNLTDSDISQVIRNALKEVGAKNPEVICTIPSRLVMTKNIELPSRHPQEIREIINLQSGRYTPYSREEIIIDYINIGIYRQNYTKALLIIVPQNVVKRHLAILHAAGLKIKQVSVAPEAIGRIYSTMAKMKTADTPTSIIHVSDDCTDFTIVFRNKMIFTRNLPVGLNNLLREREKCQQDFIEEVKKSLESYQSEDIERTPGNIVLTGTPEAVTELKPTLDSLYIPSTVAPYLEHLPVKREVLDFAANLKQLSFLDVISPLFIAEELLVNLIPPEIKLSKALEERGREIIKMGIYIMAGLALICGILMSRVYFKKAYLEKLSLKYRSANQEAAGLEKTFARMQIIRNYLSQRGYSLDVLSELYSVISADIYLNHIRFVERGEFSIKGSAESMSSVFTLVGDMEKSPYFQNVKTKYTTRRKAENKDLTDFQITSSLEAGGG